jgi:hypothetical protein
VWQHDPDHRRGVPYRNPGVRQQFIRPPASPDVRREFRGRVPAPGTGFDRGNRSSAVPGGTRPEFRDNRSGTNVVPRPSFERQPNALEGIGRGQDARDASGRGHASSPPRPFVAAPPRPPAASNAPRFSPPANVSTPRSGGSAPSPAQRAPASAPRQGGEVKR